MTMEQAITTFKGLLERKKMFSSAMTIMGFDSNTIAPKGSVQAQSKRDGFFGMEIYKLETSEEMKNCLDILGENLGQLDEVTRAEYRLAKKNYDQSTKIPADLVRRSAELSAQSHAAWEEARKNNHFATYAPFLKEMIDLQKEALSYRIEPGQSPYDVLLDDYEEGMDAKTYDQFFNQLKQVIVPLLKLVTESPYQVETGFLKQFVAKDTQKAISRYAAEKVGYDLNRGYIGESTHPFCNGYDKTDVRITTRYDEQDFQSSFYGVLHECGHALYEQNVSDDINGTTLGRGVSMGIHESQSRFVENVIGRSQAFWENASAELKGFLPEGFKDVTPQMFYEAVNESKPSLIRVEADELTYSLHILIRYEIEKMLFTTDVDVNELPQIWNKKYEEYLGVTPPTDTLGVLQDVHWSWGAFGYFPTYAIGSAYSAQLLAYMEKDLNVEELIRQGDLATVVGWLTDKIHQYGSVKPPRELIKSIAGEELDASYYTDYLVKKFSTLYKLTTKLESRKDFDLKVDEQAVS